MKSGSKSDLQNGAGALNFGTPFWTLFEPLAAPWEHHGAPGPQKVSSVEGLFSGPDFGLSFGPSQMCSGAFSLQSQLDFHVFSVSQNGSKMDPKMDPSEVQNLHYAPLGSSQERFGLSFLGFRIEAEKWVEKKSSGRTLGEGSAAWAGRWGGFGGGLELGFMIQHASSPHLWEDEGRRI